MNLRKFSWRIKFFFNLCARGEFRLATQIARGYAKKRIRILLSRNRAIDISKSTIKYIENYHGLMEQRSPVLAVIMPHVNYARFLDESLTSVLNSTLKNFIVVVIESGSDETNADMVSKIQNRIVDSRLSFDFGERRRLGANRNHGISLASHATFICSFDPDDIMSPQYLELTLFHAVRDVLDISGSSMKVVGLETGIWSTERWVATQDLLFRNALASNAIFTNKIWEKAGGFVDSLPLEPLIHEDWRFWQRASLLGARIGNITKPLITIRIHGSNMSRDPKFLTEQEIARLIREKNSDIGMFDSLQKTSLFRKREKIQNLRATPSDMSQLAILARRPEDNVGKHILFVVPWLDVSGGTKVTLRVAEYLSSLNYRVTFVTTELRPDHVKANSIQFETFALPECLDDDLWLDFMKYLVESRGTSAIWQVGSTWLYQNISNLVRPGLSFFDSLFIPNSQHMKTSASLSQYFNRIFVESQVNAQAYIDLGGSAKVCIAPNGVEFTNPNNPVVPDERSLVAFIGRLAPEKNPQAFIEIVELIAREKIYRTFDFVIAGTGVLQESLLREIERKNLRVRILGHVDEVEDLLKRTRVVIQTSTSAEGRPNVLLEAAANGVPVIATNVGAISDIVIHGETGFLVHDGENVSAANYLRKILADDELWLRLSLNALKRAETEFRWDDSLSLIHRNIEDVIKNN